MRSLFLSLAAICTLLGTLCSAWAVVRRARNVGGYKMVLKQAYWWFARNVLRKTINNPQYLTGHIASVSSVIVHSQTVRAEMPSTEPERTNWLANRVNALSQELANVQSDLKKANSQREEQITKLQQDLATANEVSRSNALSLASDGIGLEALGSILLVLGCLFGLFAVI